MVGRPLLLPALVVALVVIAIVYARPLLGPPGPTASPAAGLTATPTAPVAPASPTPTPTPTPSPTRSPTASCPPVPVGGATGSFHSLADVRVAAQGGLDRVVFDFGQERSSTDQLPAFTIERASSFTGISGQRVPVEGDALWSVRFEGASTADQQGRVIYQGRQDLRPNTALVRQVRLVEDFEAVLIWGIGLQRLECPAVQVLRSPLRLVLDFPSS